MFAIRFSDLSNLVVSLAAALALSAVCVAAAVAPAATAASIHMVA